MTWNVLPLWLCPRAPTALFLLWKSFHPFSWTVHVLPHKMCFQGTSFKEVLPSESNWLRALHVLGLLFYLEDSVSLAVPSEAFSVSRRVMAPHFHISVQWSWQVSESRWPGDASSQPLFFLAWHVCSDSCEVRSYTIKANADDFCNETNQKNWYWFWK